MSDLSPADIPQAWLQRAQSDLALAQAALETPNVLREDACFHMQQCAEKALKALLLYLAIDFPRTHAIEALLDLLQDAGVEIPENINESFFLSQYAVETRYPGEWQPVTDEESQTALEMASQVLSWVETTIDE